jgi:Putative DNA-binding domain
MSLSSYRSTINRLQKEIADLQNKASQFVQQQADRQKQIGREQYSLSRCKNPSQASSAQQKIANLRSKAAQLEKSESEIRKQIAGKQKDLDTYDNRLQNELKREQKKQEEEFKKAQRREQEIRHLGRQINAAATPLQQYIPSIPASRGLFAVVPTVSPQRNLDREIVELINQGESATLEFKSSARWNLKENKPDKTMEGVILKTVAAFLNSEGGTLLIGVADDGQIVGLQHDYQINKKQPNRDGYEQFLTQFLLRDNIGLDFCDRVKFSFHSMDREEVCKVSISKSPKPVFLTVKDKHGQSEEQFWIRSGNSSHQLAMSKFYDYSKERFG